MARLSSKQRFMVFFTLIHIYLRSKIKIVSHKNYPERASIPQSLLLCSFRVGNRNIAAIVKMFCLTCGKV